jgi:hypothetical protein
LSGDASVSAPLCILGGCEQETKAIAAHRKAASRLRPIYRIVAGRYSSLVTSCYSTRSATIGSTRAARRAGM